MRRPVRVISYLTVLVLSVLFLVAGNWMTGKTSSNQNIQYDREEELDKLVFCGSSIY